MTAIFVLILLIKLVEHRYSESGTSNLVLSNLFALVGVQQGSQTPVDDRVDCLDGELLEGTAYLLLDHEVLVVCDDVLIVCKT